MKDIGLVAKWFGAVNPAWGPIVASNVTQNSVTYLLVGQSVTVKLTVTASNPWTIQWYWSNNTAIAGATTGSYQYICTHAGVDDFYAKITETVSGRIIKTGDFIVRNI